MRKKFIDKIYMRDVLQKSGIWRRIKTLMVI